MKTPQNTNLASAAGHKYPFWPSLVACVLLPVYLELMLHLLVYGAVSSRIVYPLLFAASAGM